MFYFVGVPIGNIKDASLRSVETLIGVDVILAEDTRTFSNFYKKVQETYNLKPLISQKIIPYYKDVEFLRLPEVLEFIENGLNIALVSESGMPLISDPGNLLIQNLIKKNIKYKVIPSTSAYLTALVYSGFEFKNSLFLGFLPKKQTEIKKLFLDINNNSLIKTVLYYESPERFVKSIKILEEILPNVKLCVCRELTKTYEEILFGKPKDFLTKSIKGEICVVFEK